MADHQVPPSLGFSRQEHWNGLPFPSPMHESEKWKWSLSVLSDSSRPHGLQPTRLRHPWDFPGKSTGVVCHCKSIRIICVKYYKPIRVQYFIASCASCVPRANFVGLTNKLDLWTCSLNGTHSCRRFTVIAIDSICLSAKPTFSSNVELSISL